MLLERAKKVKDRVHEIETELADPELLKDRSRLQARSKELARLKPIATLYEEHERIAHQISEAETLIKGEPKDEELLKLYQDEYDQLGKRKETLETQLENKLLEGTDPDSDRNIIVEIRAGTGGDEASLFAHDLFRMYSRYAQDSGLKIEVMDTSLTGKGGFKEVIFGVSGSSVYRKFRFESGTHRVQRVPETEASGRIHTSAATVAVLPEANEVEINIKPEDVRIDICRSGGPGGQGVNTTDSSVQLLHLATGLIVRCQDERSQHKNKAKAFRVLRARLLERERAEQSRKISENRKKQVGSGDRSEKIRTYNFPDRRVTDHRIGLTLHALQEILDGKLEELFSALDKEDRMRRLKVG
jgi:peptide chain release factor 1